MILLHIMVTEHFLYDIDLMKFIISCGLVQNQIWGLFECTVSYFQLESHLNLLVSVYSLRYSLLLFCYLPVCLIQQFLKGCVC